MMDETTFWAMIDQANAASQGDMEAKCEAIEEAVAELEPVDAEAFGRHFDAAMDRAYTWALWGAAYVIAGGCSDDAFMDFRATLISLGQATYERVLQEPESLADMDFSEEDLFFEGFQYAALDAVEEVLGEAPERDQPVPAEPSGVKWDEDKVYDLYPRLADKYA
jgi:Protein of unknown function (DUF4240)